MSTQENDDNEDLDRLYVIIEVLSDGKKQIAVLDQEGKQIAAVTANIKTARRLLVRFSADATLSKRKFILAEYAKANDLMALKPWKENV